MLDVFIKTSSSHLVLELFFTQYMHISLDHPRQESMPSLFTIVGAAALLLPEAVLGAVTPNHPAVANHALAPNFGCNILGVSEYFAEQYPVPQQCQDHYSVQVRDLCREYLNLIRTVYTTTVTPVVTRTNSFTTRTTATVFTTS